MLTVPGARETFDLSWRRRRDTTVLSGKSQGKVEHDPWLKSLVNVGWPLGLVDCPLMTLDWLVDPGFVPQMDHWECTKACIANQGFQRLVSDATLLKRHVQQIQKHTHREKEEGHRGITSVLFPKWKKGPSTKTVFFSWTKQSCATKMFTTRCSESSLVIRYLRCFGENLKNISSEKKHTDMISKCDCLPRTFNNLSYANKQCWHFAYLWR